MPELIITRGLPGCGKTTNALEWVGRDPLHRARSNRDDLRQSLYGGAGVLDRAQEDAITQVQQATVRALLAAGTSVVVDDMNLRVRYARRWAELAEEMGATFIVWTYWHVSIEACIHQDAERQARGGRGVGEQAIRALRSRYDSIWGKPLPSPAPPPAPYVRPSGREKAWIVDIDGTLARMGGRSPYDWAAVGQDQVAPAVRSVVCSLGADYSIILMSGRDASCREATEDWLSRHSVPWDYLYMRSAGDTRRDCVVKAELFDKHVREQFDIQGVLDDRDQVVAMWRRMGLQCLQVAPGNF